MIVMKFGGSSVANAERLRHVGRIVAERAARRPVVVLSAMGDTTDYLLEAAERALSGGGVSIERIEALHLGALGDLALPEGTAGEVRALLSELRSLLQGISLTGELTARTKDHLVSFGERLSVRIAAAWFRQAGLEAAAYDAWDVGFVSDSHYGQAELDRESWDRVRAKLVPLLDAGILPVVTGFIARDGRGSITTLGRGGSDRSATIIAAALEAEEAQIWKDVDGILTADPRLVPEARPVEAVTYEEAQELAYFGSQVLHPRAMQPCLKTNTPVVVKNSYNPEAAGTRIVPFLPRPADPVRALTTRKNVTLIDIVSTRMVGQPGFLERVFAGFARSGISVDMVATSEVSVSLTLDSLNEINGVEEELSRFATVEVKTGKAIVTIIGDVSRSSEILRRAFGVCMDLGVQVQMISQGASKVNLSFIVDDTQADIVVRELHKNYFE
ncbi:MAG: aspartate kinase [Spirochaetaceae bacterium]|jgi:aspartate kinase|nr:aspartate kinase [Spirochaetaceae bacterium]